MSRYEAIDKKYRKYIYWIVYQKLQNKEDREDATQDTLLKVWKLIDRIGDDDEKNKSFIAKIAKYTAIDYYRKRSSYKYTRIIYQECDFECIDTEKIVINRIVSKEFIDDLKEVDKQAAVILFMKYADELSHDEIAVILNISPVASRRRLSRAIKLMRNNRTLKKYKVNPLIVLVIVLALILTACAVKPIREFLIEKFQEFTHLRKESVEIIETFEIDKSVYTSWNC